MILVRFEKRSGPAEGSERPLLPLQPVYQVDVLYPVRRLRQVAVQGQDVLPPQVLQQSEGAPLAVHGGIVGQGPGHLVELHLATSPGGEVHLVVPVRTHHHVVPPAPQLQVHHVLQKPRGVVHPVVQGGVPQAHIRGVVLRLDLHHPLADEVVGVHPVEDVGVLDRIEVLVQGAPVGYPRTRHEGLPRGQVAYVGVQERGEPPDGAGVQAGADGDIPADDGVVDAVHDRAALRRGVGVQVDDRQPALKQVLVEPLLRADLPLGRIAEEELLEGQRQDVDLHVPPPDDGGEVRGQHPGVGPSDIDVRAVGAYRVDDPLPSGDELDLVYEDVPSVGSEGLRYVAVHLTVGRDGEAQPLHVHVHHPLPPGLQAGAELGQYRGLPGPAHARDDLDQVRTVRERFQLPEVPLADQLCHVSCDGMRVYNVMRKSGNQMYEIMTS